MSETCSQVVLQQDRASKQWMTYTKESVDEVSFDLAEVLVLDHEKGMFLVLCPHQHAKPRLLREPDHTKLRQR